MELREALVLRMSFNDVCGEIKVDENGYICLNDLAVYYPHKRMDNWRSNSTTKEFIDVVDEYLNTSNSSDLKSIVTRRGKYNGGTYAHDLVAMEFAMWISPEFKLKVLLAYRDGTQRKENWNMVRVLASRNYKIMSNAVENAHDPAKSHHFSNEAKMINKIVFGMHQKNIRDIAKEDQLEQIAVLESDNTAYIKIGMPYSERKKVLTEQHQIANQKQIE